THKNLFPPPAEIARPRTNNESDQRAHRDHTDRHNQAHPRAVNEFGQNITAVFIKTQPVTRGRWLKAIRKRHHRRIMRTDIWRGHRHQRDGKNDHGARDDLDHASPPVRTRGFTTPYIRSVARLTKT